MALQTVSISPDFSSWQRAARRLLQQNVSPPEVSWISSEMEQMALGEPSAPGPAAAAAGSPFRVPKEFLAIARRVACNCDEDRWSLLYSLLWRITRGERHLLDLATDPEIVRLRELDKEVRREIHKMRAFVRFREISTGPDETWFVAWFEPEHFVVEMNAPFFIDRFAHQRWSILTPYRCAHWDGKQIHFTAGAQKSDAPPEDAAEHLWLTYYSSIFNPARLKVHAMKTEMPMKYWRNLPEAALIPHLIREAPRRVDTMLKQNPEHEAGDRGEAADFSPAPVPATKDWQKVREAAAHCQACPLWKKGTQTVFGEGSHQARVVLLGEQPGDQEDLAGRPFVGPAGQLLDRALEEAGIDRSTVYVTNTVKHFKWEPRGKRRLHQKPNSREIAACRPWLEAELQIIKPELLVCLGATAAQAIFGPKFRVTQERGVLLDSPFAVKVLATVHPSSLLRQPDEESRTREYAHFLADLRVAAAA